MLLGEEKKDKSLRHEIIFFSDIPDKWRIVNNLLDGGVSQEDEGPVHALHATCLALKNLWYLHGIESKDDPEWKTIRETVLLGLIKDTKKQGNTSVSMGAAKLKFDENKSTRRVGFLNCGTGGIKYQLYSSKRCQHLKDEFKPKGGASPNALEIGSFKPKQPVSFEATKELLAKELANKDIPWAEKEDVPLYAFVTGTIREHWERADEQEKAVLEAKMKELFEPHNIKPQGPSYFMPQDDEGTLELLGAQQMYANLVEAGLLDSGTKVVGSLGIGKGSCQWMIQEPDGKMTLVGHKAGMTNLPKLAELSDTLTTAYGDSVKWTKFKQSLQAAGNGLIALKSGAALLIDNKNYAKLKQELVARETYRPRTVHVTLGGAGPIEPHTWTGSLDRLCAEVQSRFGVAHDLEVVWRQDQFDRPVDRHAEVGEADLLYFTQRGVIPSPLPAQLVEEFKKKHAASREAQKDTVMLRTAADMCAIQ